MEHIGDKIIGFFKNAGTKLEELQVQTALGKAELNDKFEEIKKETKEKFQNLKEDLHKEVEKDKEKWKHAKAKLEHLEVQLALGKAETQEELQEQKKKLHGAIHSLKEIISKD